MGADVERLPVTVVGVGGVGSPTALLLAKHGHSLTLYDPDTVEDRNVANQLYGPDDIGLPKVQALAQHVADLTDKGGTTQCRRAMMADSQVGTPVVVVCVDSLEARREVLEACVSSPAVRIVVDVRVGHGSIKVYALNPKDPAQVATYRESLAGVGFAGMCVVQFEAHVAFMAAALAVRALTHITDPGVGGVERLLILDVDSLGVVQDGPHPWA